MKKWYNDTRVNIQLESDLKGFSIGYSDNAIDFDKVLDYFSNNSLSATAEYFNLPRHYLDRLFSKLNIPKHSISESTKLSQKKYESTMLKKYGYAHPFQNKELAKKASAMGRSDEALEKLHTTSFEKYGTSWPIASEPVREKIKQTNLERHGYEMPLGNSEVMLKSAETKLSKYGNACYTNRDQSIETNLKNHNGVYCTGGTNDSKPNKYFAALLEENNIKYTTEFILKPYRYDFKVGNYLIEINPTATHNSTFGILGEPKDINYHKDKSQVAYESGYRCMHVWDWDNVNAIIELLKPKERVGARKCILKEVSLLEAKEFISKYHIQGYAKDQIRLGLFYEDKLVSIMTFGKSRYNRNYEYELIRYCSSKNIIGGAEKLFSYFVKIYNPQSIISYCDMSKFSGDTYIKLGFELKRQGMPSKHWYNVKTKRHITDNLLRNRGFDQLFNENYGKCTSNKELMLEHNFVEIYDCGQNTYVRTFNDYRNDTKEEKSLEITE